MFDDFDVTVCIEEIIPEEYEDWCAWVYGGRFVEDSSED